MAAIRRRLAARPNLTTLGGAVAAALLIAAGLWVSLHYCLVAWKADSDIFVSVEIWRGVRDHGLSFLRTWGYTADNWLLSLVPITSLIYAAFGATPRVTVLVGWLLFVSSVGLTGWLTAWLAGRAAAMAVVGVLLFANYYALGPIGFLGYPISHNLSMAWGLLILLLALWGIERRLYGPCVAAAVALFIDAVSDPWASAAIAVPLVLVSGALAVANRRTRLGACALVLCATSAVAFWAAYKHPFGLLRFLPRGHFQFGGADAAWVNLRFGYRALAVMFNILPGASLDAPSTQLVSVAALAAIVGGSVLVVLSGLRQAGAGRQLVGGVAILSIGAIGALYLLGPPNAGLDVGRFFPNLYFLGALLAAMAAAALPRGWPSWAARGSLAVYGGLFVLSGAVMTPRMWLAPIAASEPPAASALGAQLRGHGLSYGYGPYWGADALAMQTLTGGAVTIRPILIKDGRVARRPIETSSLWYAPAAEPAGEPLFIVIRSDVEGCSALDACEAVARRQFGEPAERLVLGDAVVLVWRRPLAGLIDP